MNVTVLDVRWTPLPKEPVKKKKVKVEEYQPPSPREDGFIDDPKLMTEVEKWTEKFNI